MSWNVISLVLACATGWSLLFIGYLPVSSVRRLAAEPVKAAGAWAVVAVTAPPAVFHWYLIFAVISLVAWTKLDGPAGKIWIALAAALGVVFPLETSPVLLALESPLALASLYLGGATMGLAYLVCVTARPDREQVSMAGHAKGLVLVAVSWTVLLSFALLHLVEFPRSLNLPGNSSAILVAHTWTPLIPAIVVVVLAFATWTTARRNASALTPWLAGATVVMALVTSLLAQFVIRTIDMPIANR
jgi:hypothetical protein